MVILRSQNKMTDFFMILDLHGHVPLIYLYSVLPTTIFLLSLSNVLLIDHRATFA